METLINILAIIGTIYLTLSVIGFMVLWIGFKELKEYE